MPNKPKKPCKYPGCPELVASGYCAAHERPRIVDRDPVRQRLYGRAWQKRRINHLSKHPWCEACMAAERYEAATDVHHTIAHKGNVNLFWSSPLESLCHSCHSRVTASEGRGGSKVWLEGTSSAGVEPCELISQCGESS
jgi:5-methylcytosine-specific restriction protein A